MEIILTGVVILALVFVLVLDGDMKKTKSFGKDKKIVKASKKSNSDAKGKVSQNALPFKQIRSAGGADSPALVIKDDDTYVGGVEVYGVNYNLLSTSEKLVLEEVFQKTLNGLDYPIQIYVQSRKINLDSYNALYKKRIDELKDVLKQEQNKFTRLTERQAELAELQEAKSDVERAQSQITYGESVIEFINRISASDDILDKKYFIMTPYYYDASQFNQKQTEEEKFETAFNAIINRLESILMSLHGGNMEGKVLNGVEMAELLYNSYNKPDADKYKLGNAIKSGFANYIVTSRPVEYKFIDHEKRVIEEKYKQKIRDIENGVYAGSETEDMDEEKIV